MHLIVMVYILHIIHAVLQLLDVTESTSPNLAISAQPVMLRYTVL